MNRFVPVQPERAAQWETLRSAFALHELLTALQCDAGGRVNYGRPFGYAWLLARWPGNPDDRPCIRTLKYHMAKLKKARLIEMRVLGFGRGMVVRLLGSAKWQKEAPAPATQLSLYSPPPVPIRVQKPVDKQRESTVSQIHMGQEFAPNGGKSLPRKEVKNLAKETIRAAAVAHALPSVEKPPEEFEARHRLLREQAEMLSRKFKTAG